MLDEMLVPTVASEGRLGHKLRGIVATYAHESPPMVEMVTVGLQARWERTLIERVRRFGGHSSVPVVDALLGTARKIVSEDRPQLVPQTVLPIFG
ncbi:hypothetical protein [Nonomuraea sp. NPDC023979]|uniref:hypothetical protein n=1 Tax=Nonomuraea sp. NPDC023979 TaxID=3154796 RepID=UPI0033F12B7A